MTAIQAGTKGRNFTAEELVGRRVRIECPSPKKKGLPVAHALMIVADDEMVGNACRLELIVEPNDIIQVKITLYRFDPVEPDGPCPTEEVILRDNIELSFSAIVSEVQ